MLTYMCLDSDMLSRQCLAQYINLKTHSPAPLHAFRKRKKRKQNSRMRTPKKILKNTSPTKIYQELFLKIKSATKL